MSSYGLLLCFGIFFIVHEVRCESEIRKVIMEQATKDLDSSASAYVYRQDGKDPGHVVYLNSGEFIGAFNGKPIPYTLNSDSEDLIPFAQNNKYYGSYNPQVEYHHPVEYSKPIVYAPQAEYIHPPVYPHLTHEELQIDDDDDGIPVGHHGGLAPYTHHHGGHETGFVKQGGSNYGLEEHSKHGHEGSNGYNKAHEFSKGDHGHHENQEHSGFYENNGGKKASNYNEGNNHHEFHEGATDSKGGKFGEKKHHRKGSKTTGYHNVFHKDEYKKDHTFYDDADHSGHYNKYGAGHEYYNNDAGKYNKGGHHESGVHQDHYGKKGYSDKGHYDSADAGYKGSHGLENHHAHQSDYAKKGGSQSESDHGYRQSSGGHHY